MVKISEKNPTIKCYSSGRRELCQDIIIEFNGGIYFKVPKGFECDGSSIPRFFWRVFGSPTTGPNLLAGIVHDYLYHKGSNFYDRKKCDEIFYEVLVELGKPKVLARGMYYAVRWFGKKHYG